MKCDKAEHFCLKVLAYPCDLKVKAETMLQLQVVAPKINTLISRITCWKVVYDSLTQNQILRDTVGITMRLGMLLNQESSVKAFDLPALLKLFDLRSTHNRDKCGYHLVMKQLLRLRKITWLELQDELVSEHVV